MPTSSERTLVIIPTYNESENLPRMLDRIDSATPEVDVLVVDDNSPDGTGDLADAAAEKNSRVHVLHRTEKNGLLGAYLAGFSWGLTQGFNVLVEMDADGSHAPEQLPFLLEQIEDGADLVIGSRYIKGGEVVNWPKNRFLLSRLGNLYISLALGTGVRDMTAGFRAIRREVLETVDIDALSDAGYIFQVEFAYRAWQANFDVREVPITFTEREYGESKLDGSFVKDSLVEVTKWGIAHRTQQVKDFSQEFSGILAHQYQGSKLSAVSDKARAAGTTVRDLAWETQRILRHEYEESNLSKGGQRIGNLGAKTVTFGKEILGLIKHEAKDRRR